MESIIRFLRMLDGKIVCPMHSRTKKCLKSFGLWEELQDMNNMEIIEPVGYGEMIALMQRAKLIVTDSGGVSKESSFAGAKCIFMLELDVWDDLVKAGWIFKLDPEKEERVEQALRFAKEAARVPEEERPKYYGYGHTAEKIVDLLEEHSFI